MLGPGSTLAEIVLEHPEAEPVLRRRRLDFATFGARKLGAACGAAGSDPAEVLGELRAAIAEGPDPMQLDPRPMTTAQLVSYLISRHHGFARRALPQVVELSAHVGEVHRENHPELPRLAEAVAALAGPLRAQLDRSERELFPALVAGGAGLGALLEEERAALARLAALLARVRDAAGGFAAPEWACRSHRALCAQLELLEADVQRCLHLELNVLFPRARAG